MSNPILPAAVRTALQVWWGSAVAWLATIGVTVPDETSALVEGALLALVIGLVTAGIRWLETRQGDGWQVWARKLASVLMLGMSGAQPTYQSAASDAQVSSTTRTRKAAIEP